MFMEKKKDERLKNIIKIEEGVYEIQLSNGYRDDGKRDRVVKRVRGDEEYAIAYRDKLKKELEEKKKKGLKTANEGYTFLEVTKSFLEDKDYGKKVGTTLSGYKMYLNNYILPEFADKKIRNITEDDLNRLYKKMAHTPSKSGKGYLTGTTIKHTHTLIGTIFNYAKFKKWTIYNPTEFANTPKADSKERDYYDHEEIVYALSCLDKMTEHKNGMSDRILHSQNLRFKTAITILFNTGLRRGELFGLKWGDIKYKRGIFQIRRSITTVDAEEFAPEDIVEDLHNGIVCKNLKTESSRRDIYVPKVCFDLLGEYKGDQRKCGFPTQDKDYVFQNVRTPGIWNPNNLTKEWTAFKATFDLKDITIHDIRHSHATDLLSMGVPIQDVSRRLGHSDVGTTLRIYTHSNIGQDKLIAERLESKYENNFVSHKLTIASILTFITGIDFASQEEISSSILYLTGQNVNEENYDTLKHYCKDYIIKQYDYFKNIKLFVNDDINENLKMSLLNIISNMNKDANNIRPIFEEQESLT